MCEAEGRTLTFSHIPYDDTVSHTQQVYNGRFFSLHPFLQLYKYWQKKY